MTKLCEVCHREFKTSRASARYCGMDCFNKARRERPEYIHKKGAMQPCQFCGEEFYVSANKIGIKKFCSLSCSRNNAVKLQKDRHQKGVCAQCGSEFEYTSHPGQGRKYCSRRCKDKSHTRNPFQLVCASCGKEFTATSKRRRYCSIQCFADVRKVPDKNSVVFSKIRRSMKRNGEMTKCEECGYHKHPEILSVHHRDLDGKHHTRENLIVLCPNCHSLKHGHCVVQYQRQKRPPLPA